MKYTKAFERIKGIDKEFKETNEEEQKKIIE